MRVGVPGPEKGCPTTWRRSLGEGGSWVFGVGVNSSHSCFKPRPFPTHSCGSFLLFSEVPALCWMPGLQEKSDQALSRLGQTEKSFGVPGPMGEIVRRATGTQSLELEGVGAGREGPGADEG